MAETTLNRLRTLWLNIHLWIGVGLVVLLAPLGVSGVALVWRPELDHMLHPARYVVSDSPGNLSPSAYLAAGAAALGPGVAPSRIAYPQTTGAPIVVSGVRAGGSGPPRPINAWLDPATGKALTTGSTFGGETAWPICGKAIQIPVTDRIASGMATRIPARWCRFMPRKMVRRQRNAVVKGPRGHHSQIPSRVWISMATPSTPTT